LIDLVWLQIQDLYKEAGVLGFWKGVIPALIMVSRCFQIFFLLNDFTRVVHHVSPVTTY
jgi:hypothetical protein